MVGCKLTLKSSWQHLQDNLNRWELGCIEEISMNSASGRSIKPNKIDSYKRKLENIEQFYKDGLITPSERRTASAHLNNIIDGIEALNKKQTHS